MSQMRQMSQDAAVVKPTIRVSRKSKQLIKVLASLQGKTMEQIADEAISLYSSLSDIQNIQQKHSEITS